MRTAFRRKCAEHLPQKQRLPVAAVRKGAHHQGKSVERPLSGHLPSAGHDRAAARGVLAVRKISAPRFLRGAARRRGVATVAKALPPVSDHKRRFVHSEQPHEGQRSGKILFAPVRVRRDRLSQAVGKIFRGGICRFATRGQKQNVGGGRFPYQRRAGRHKRRIAHLLVQPQARRKGRGRHSRLRDRRPAQAVEHSLRLTKAFTRGFQQPRFFVLCR